jgi:formylglycine-generating enzyme required for sulfatase activity
MVMEALAQKGHPNPFAGAERFLEYTDVRSGLLQASDAGDSYSFPHLTFQEYLAGLELVNDVAFVERILVRRNDDRWRVPIALGMSHTISEGVPALFAQLLDEMLYQGGRTPEQEQRDLLLAAELAEDAGWYRLEHGGAALKRLRRDLAVALVPVVEGTALPAKERVQAGVYLGKLGDPRPGVCTLPPDMVQIEGGEFVLGITTEESKKIGAAHKKFYLALGNKSWAQSISKWQENEINDQPLTLPTFEIARYLLTNAQYKLFIDDGGYAPDAPWWDELGRIWLLRDDTVRRGLQTRRDHKQYPQFWHDERYGIARPNQPVVGISWCEAIAFCKWLTQHQTYNPGSFIYLLPSEAEWEYAARHTIRRTYPWGNEQPDMDRANFGENHRDYGRTAVGCFAPGATPEKGLHDLTGNVWQWTRSEFRDYPYDPNDGRENVDITLGAFFVVRGSMWNGLPDFRRCSRRDNVIFDSSNSALGFRLVRYPPSDKDRGAAPDTERPGQSHLNLHDSMAL